MSGVYFSKFLKVIFLLSLFEKNSSSVIPSAHFISNIPLHLHVSNSFTTPSSFFPTVRVSDPQRATLQIQLLK